MRDRYQARPAPVRDYGPPRLRETAEQVPGAILALLVAWLGLCALLVGFPG